MRIQDAAKAVGCTCRAIKFYEEKGLLPHVVRSENGYRDYTESDLALLHQITAYRKLGIAITDIRELLRHGDDAALQAILDKKKAALRLQQNEVAALEQYIASRGTQALNASVDYHSLSEAIQSQIPGKIGLYLAKHFAPYLNVTIETEAQRSAYQTILDFWDSPSLKLPLSFHFLAAISQLTQGLSKQPISCDTIQLPEPESEEYAQLKARTDKIVKLRKHPLVQYQPAEILKRSMMRGLRDCGYYDVFLPALEQLSPPYRQYREKLNALNKKLCKDLNLYYDSDFHLRMVKQKKDR